MTVFSGNLSNYFCAYTRALYFIRSGADGASSNIKISKYRKEERAHTEMLNFPSALYESGIFAVPCLLTLSAHWSLVQKTAAGLNLF